MTSTATSDRIRALRFEIAADQAERARLADQITRKLGEVAALWEALSAGPVRS